MIKMQFIYAILYWYIFYKWEKGLSKYAFPVNLKFKYFVGTWTSFDVAWVGLPLVPIVQKTIRYNAI